MDELKEASNISSKPGKSPGLDGIDNEMLVGLFQEYRKLILQLFNIIYSTKQNIALSSTAIISPICKTRPMGDLLSSTLLNNGVIKFAREQNIFSENQPGFISGNRTSDTHNILHN